MARNVFYSFHYVPDNWRASQVRNMGVIEGNEPAKDNDWETITGGGEPAIKRWINEQMSGRTCAVVLIGTGTAGRKWINHEIIKAWDEGKGVFGVYIHNLKDREQKASVRGSNPFDKISLGNTGKLLSSVVQAYDPPYILSTDVYAYIKNNMSAWVEAAIKTRNSQ